jgi:tRNA pseudouridine55 synthase
MGRRKGLQIDGWINLDKPAGLTSTAAVGRVRYLLQAAKAGHAGTLDPLATGVLPIALGEATKTVPYAMDATKTYRFSVCWGVETATDDMEGDVVAAHEGRPVLSEIEALLPRFTGEILQTPPSYSAIKVDGARAYDLAREGVAVELQARPVTVSQLRILEAADQDTTTFEAVCSKGTYVRSLARDMGRVLGCYGHVCALRRTRVGPFSEGATISLDKLQEISHSAAGRVDFGSFLKPVEVALDDIPALDVSQADAMRLKQGQTVLLRGRDAPILTGSVSAISRGRLVAIGEVRYGELHPTRVFNISDPPVHQRSGPEAGD